MSGVVTMWRLLLQLLLLIHPQNWLSLLYQVQYDVIYQCASFTVLVCVFVCCRLFIYLFLESDISNEQFQCMVEWLKHNISPTTQVNSFMEKTAVKRAEWIRINRGESFENILREYPRLFDTPGMVSMMPQVLV